MVRRGNGLENMQKRADEIGANLCCIQNKMKGHGFACNAKSPDEVLNCKIWTICKVLMILRKSLLYG